MCGRFTLRAPASVVAEQFALFELPPFAPRFNVAPSQPIAVVRLGVVGTEPQRALAWLRWGLIPSWAKDPAVGNRMINARSETVAEKPAFRTAFKRRRCLVVADGFYEWQKLGDGRRKQPYFIRMRDDRPFALAGLWESWEGADHSQLETCTILTTEANDLMRPIHDRMPVILPTEHYDAWLDVSAGDAATLTPLLCPYPSEPMQAEPIGTYVNRPSNEGPKCIEPERDLFS
jgi:putative SOS response-associated peptidase YedK